MKSFRLRLRLLLLWHFPLQTEDRLFCQTRHLERCLQMSELQQRR